ncbi:MAG: ABC transporter permease [Pseudomonadota bacterium]
MSVHAWLTAETADSDLHANLQRLYAGTRSVLRNPLGLAGLIVILALILVAAFAPVLATYSPYEQNLQAPLLPPGGDHIMGTDELGRDIWSRLVYGARITLLIVVLVSVIAAPLGLLLGTVSGTMGGIVDIAIMRVTDLFLAFPSLILALAFVAALGPGLENAIVAIALTAWPPIARLARAETLVVRGSDYIAAVRLQGASTLRLILRHVVPMCIPSVVVRVTLNMAAVILTAAGLGFLGLGAQPPTAEWGAMVSTGRRYMLDSWWVVTMPGIAILTVSLAFNLFGDALRDVLDPRGE